MRHRSVLFVVILLAMVATVPVAEAKTECIDYPDTGVYDPGPEWGSYCAGSGNGCMLCRDIIIVNP